LPASGVAGEALPEAEQKSPENVMQEILRSLGQREILNLLPRTV
jgi:hypothetical protein